MKKIYRGSYAVDRVRAVQELMKAVADERKKTKISAYNDEATGARYETTFILYPQERAVKIEEYVESLMIDIDTYTYEMGLEYVIRAIVDLKMHIEKMVDLGVLNYTTEMLIELDVEDEE